MSDWAGSNFVPDRLLKRQRTSPIIASSSSSSSSTTTTMSSPRRRNLRDASQRRQVLNRRENNTPISTTYRVVPLTANSPDVATSILINPANKEASPLGWHDTGIKSMKNGNTPTLTQGNNVVAVEMMTNRARSLTDLSNVAGLRAEGKKSKSCSSGGGGDGCEEKIMFEFPIDQRGIAPAKLQQGNATKSTASSSFQAGVVNVFYLANTVHDILYLYGFDEAAGNFQMNNFNKGAIIGDSNVKNKEDTSPSSSPSAGGNDAVFATVYDVAQDQAGAQFIFHPDGTPGEMRVGTFKSDDGNIKDVALEDDVVLHELFHGVVYRLVGGASQGNCLTSAEADGLNEGWADYFAWAMTMPSQNTKASSTLKKTWTIPDRFMGVFISGKREGMRNHPYSTDMKRNPYTYASLHDPELLKSGDGKTLVFPEAHDAGEVWSEMLYEVYWAMVSKYGMEPNYANSKSTSGNILLLRIVMQSLKTVKCNPTFVRARDAMLEADANIFQGKHSCDLWRGFAKRGLGAGVKETKDMQFKNDFSLPQQCSK